jgi:hypothetical protein
LCNLYEELTLHPFATMRSYLISTLTVMLSLTLALTPAQTAHAQQSAYAGFDKNQYPGDAALPTLHRYFAFAGYWLNNPPGATHNTWQGKRDALLHNGFGFLVLANGRLDAEITHTSRSTATTPAALGAKDAAAAVAAAQREHFPTGAILFLDQEEGGRLTSSQSGYLFGWTEAVAHSGYLPGAYVSGQPVPDGPGKTITTVQDIRDHVAAQHLHPVAIWVYQDACPPASGCTMQPPPPNASGTPDVTAWQYAQSPRRRDITASCSKTYAPNGNCYAPGLPGQILDLNVAASSDPSHGR